MKTPDKLRQMVRDKLALFRREAKRVPPGRASCGTKELVRQPRPEVPGDPHRGPGRGSIII